MQGKLSHIRQLGRGDPGWGQTRRWGLAGATRSISQYDAPRPVEDDGMNNRIQRGYHTMSEDLPLSAPTMNRQARVSAQIDSTPNAAFWQGYFMTGWSGMLIGFVPYLAHGGLHQNFNRNMQGAAELHPATTYDPYPSPSALYPKVV